MPSVGKYPVSRYIIKYIPDTVPYLYLLQIVEIAQSYQLFAIPGSSVCAVSDETYWSRLSFPFPHDLTIHGSNPHLLLGKRFFTFEPLGFPFVQRPLLYFPPPNSS